MVMFNKGTEAYKVSFVVTWLPGEGGREAEVSAAFCLQLGVQVQEDLFLSLQGAKARLVSMPLVKSHSRERGIAICCPSSPSISTEHLSHSAVRGAAFRSHRVGAVLSFGRCLSNRLQHGHRFNSVFFNFNTSISIVMVVAELLWFIEDIMQNSKTIDCCCIFWFCKAWFCWSYWCWREHLLQSIYGIMSWPQTLFSQFEFEPPSSPEKMLVEEKYFVQSDLWSGGSKPASCPSPM